jgi:transposase InsO family protein
MYLTAVIDWYSRCIVSWRLSDTMRAREVVACARDAFASHGTPGVMNSDQGSVLRLGGVRLAACLRARGAEHERQGTLG